MDNCTTNSTCDDLERFFNHYPAGSSLKNAAHLAQLINSDQKFLKFDYGESGNLQRYGQKTPIEYEGGKIYNCAKNFRVLRDKADMHNEKSFAHAKWTRDVGFQRGLAAIDEYWKEHKEMVVKLQAQEPCDGEDVE